MKVSSSLRILYEPPSTKSVKEDIGMKIGGIYDRPSYISAGKDMFPYFYADSTDIKDYSFIDGTLVYGYEATDYKSTSGNKVGKIYLRKQANALPASLQLQKLHIRTYEADLNLTRRLFLDNKFSIDYDNHWRFVDIETMDDKDYDLKAFGTIPIRSVSISDGKKNVWLCSDDYGGMVKGEKELLNEVYRLVMNEQIGAFYGWNVKFDTLHLERRMRHYGLKVPFYFSYLDMLEKYKFEVKGLGSYSLKEVTEHEGMAEGKIHREKRIHKMSRDELEKYNKRDVEVLKTLNDKYGFTGLWNHIASEINMPLEMLSAGNMGDQLILRRLRELGYVGINMIERETDDYIGAYVKPPVSGLYRNIGVYDFTALYPNIIIQNNKDILTFGGKVVPHILKDMLKQREEYKAKYKQTKEVKYDVMQKAMKPKINALYGLFGYKYARFYDKEIAEFITVTGRKKVLELNDYIEIRLGGIVIYIDTDSVFVDLDSLNVLDWTDGFGDLLNRKMNPYELKLEYVLDKVIFPKSGKIAPKKRYVGRYKDAKTGKWEWTIRGIEMRRGDFCRLAKETQKEVITMIFDGKNREEIVDYLGTIKTGLFEGKYDDKLVITKHLQKEVGKANTPQLRAFKMMQKLTGTKAFTTQVSYIVTHEDVYPVDENIKPLYKPSYAKYWSQHILPPVMRILNVLEDRGQAKMLSYM